MSGFSPRAAAVAGLVVLAAGCDADFFSEVGGLGFVAPELHRGTLDDFGSGDPIAVGSTVCPQFHGYYDDYGIYHELSGEDDWALRACFDAEASGPATYEGHCLHVDGPGEITWSLQPRSSTCIEDMGFPSDRVRFEGVALEDLVTEEAALVERLPASGLWTAPEGSTPPDLVPSTGAPLVIVEGVTVTAQIGLREPTRDLAVAWADGEIVVTPPSAQVNTYEEEGSDADDMGETSVLLRLVDGGAAEVALHVAGTPAAAMPVQSVPVETLVDLQIVGFFPLDAELQMPAIVRAIARDAEGRIVRGVPVTWSTEGALQSLPLWGEGRDPDYVMLDVGCRTEDEPANSEEGTVTATLGEQSAVLDLAWVRPVCLEVPSEGGDEGRPVGEDDDDPEGRDVEDDMLSCACAAASGGPSPLGLVVLGGLVGWIRRRQPSRA
jgi:MYXO-CTERM domain-containing protein